MGGDLSPKEKVVFHEQRYARMLREATDVWFHQARNFDGVKSEIGADIERHGWTVVNAPRPLPGDVGWKWNFGHGVFYAAGPLEEYGERWRQLNAWPIKVVDNEWVRERVWTHLTEELSYRFTEDEIRDWIAEKGWPYVARSHGFPYDASEED